MSRQTFGRWALIFVVLADSVPLFAKEPVQATSVHLRLIDEVDVPAETTGVLSTVLVKEGKFVSEHDVVAQIDEADAVLAVNRAKLDLDVAAKQAASRTKLETARNVLAEAGFARDRAELELEGKQRLTEIESTILYAKSAVAVAERQLNRAKDSRKAVANSVSQTELDNLQLQLDKARYDAEGLDNDLFVARLNLKIKKSELSSLELATTQKKLDLSQAEEDVQVAELARQIKESEVVRATRDLDRRKIRAPVAGMVVQLHKHRGEWVQPGEKVMRVIRLDRLRAEGFVHTKHLDRDLLNAVARVRVTVPGRPEAEFTGRVVFVSPEIDPVNEQVRVWAEVDNPDLVLRPGLRG
ncbi:MAG: HlyD family efflux transporter periplasmic adaptor subunit, partial [Planctomycetes bacterium]|nr:HlyD family efflux transporter periplasmic adaptor subunit [Planctomycetota bacterium]